MEDPLRVVSAPSLREQVTSRLRDAIASGRFKPGERLIERELCELIAVSRTSIREALRELEADGLITIVPHKGPIVTKVTVRQAESIYQVRGVLEGLAVRLFTVRASEAQLERLERAADALERVYKKFEANAFLKAKRDFYSVLLEGADNEVATSMLRNIHIRVSQLRATSLSDPGRAKESMKEIRQLLTAIRARDDDAAWAACMRHIENATKTALAVLREERVASD